MRFRKATLPVGFLVLSAAWPATLYVVAFSWRTLIEGGLFFGTVGAGACTLAWLSVAEETPSPRRGAVVGAFASLFGAVVVLPALTTGIWLVDVVVLRSDAGPEVVLGSVLAGVVALALSPLAAALGYAVAADRSRSLPGVERLERFHPGRVVPTPATRTLAVAFAVLAVAVVAGAGVQYVDPVTPKTDDGPAYAGPDAPAAAQVEQAQARTRSVSHTVVWTVPAESADAPPRMDDRLVLRHDMRRDALVFTTRLAGEYQTNLVTVDGHWYWPGNETTPPPDVELTRRTTGSGTFPYFTQVALDAPATVTDRSDGHVEVTYEAAGGPWTSRAPRPNGTRTVRIDATTGRVVAVTDRTANGTVFARIRFEDYRATNVDPPRTPVGPIAHVVEDLFHGPLNGEGTLY
ncbi:hypothetical protein [Halorubellus sp. PRR65]|uniref:hypothetical protein n=1 Tax=Halorubellus sp. PRR65 TaxID=3098148 RepID=UPI002B263B9D|nr:hypothetical protein [Halorubellus sp. PRR65]